MTERRWVVSTFMLSDDPVAIVGICVPRVAKNIDDETSTSLIIRAITGALADAGISKDEVNGACIDWPGPGGSPQGGSTNWGRQLGVTLNWVIDQGLDSVGVRAVLNAAAAIKAGLCETVVIAQGNCGGPKVAGAERRSLGDVATLEFNWPYGGWTMVRFGALARRHMHDFGTTQEQLAEVAATIRNHGHVNPEAMQYGYGPYTVDDVLASRWVAEPLHLLDCCLVGEGACAIVITSGERARALRRDPVYVLAGAMEMPQGPHANPCMNDDFGMLGAERMKVAYSQAGLTPDDVDLVSVYDPTSFEVIRQMEVLGFCKEGEGGSFIEGGRIALGGELPTNTDGGLLSHAWILTGQLTLKVIEGVRQLRGGLGDRQVPDAEVAVCTNAAPGAFHWEALILGR
jgi:acetyl-CoA acetyltransferase